MNERLRPETGSASEKASLAHSSRGSDVNTEEVPEWNTQIPADAGKSGVGQRIRASFLDALENARAGLSMREDNFFLLLSVIIGLFAGLAVVCFRISIDFTRLWLLGSGVNPGPARIVIVPTVAGLLLAQHVGSDELNVTASH